MRNTYPQLDTSSQKHICPSCGNRTFVYYLQAGGNIIHPTVGRCDREDSCGYHYPPRLYYQERELNNSKPTLCLKKPQLIKSEQSSKIDYVPLDYILKSAKTRNSHFVYFLLDFFDWETIKKTIDPYFIGCTNNGGTIFPQIDELGKCRTAKIQYYNKETGKRIHDKINWVHFLLHKKWKSEQKFNLKMCLFGLHLIRSRNNQKKTICICESEKSAIIASAVYPNFLWMSAGALHWLNVEKLLPLQGRDIILYPDTSKTGIAFQKWSHIAEQAVKQGLNVTVSTLLEESCTQEQKESGFDIADYLIYILTKSREINNSKAEMSQEEILDIFKKVNPSLDKLINKLNLGFANDPT